MFKLDLIPVVMYCICNLHNFLNDADDIANIPIIGPRMGYFGSGNSQTRVERLRTAQHIGGYGDIILYQYEVHTF
jgi:hypothetical protein